MYKRFINFMNTPQMLENRKNKLFWASIISALILLLQAVLTPFGVELTFLNDYLQTVLNSVFGLLTVLGVVRSATIGVSDTKNDDK